MAPAGCWAAPARARSWSSESSLISTTAPPPPPPLLLLGPSASTAAAALEVREEGGEELRRCCLCTCAWTQDMTSSPALLLGLLSAVVAHHAEPLFEETPEAAMY